MIENWQIGFLSFYLCLMIYTILLLKNETKILLLLYLILFILIFIILKRLAKYLQEKKKEYGV
jgi:hypothetical protein